MLRKRLLPKLYVPNMGTTQSLQQTQMILLALYGDKILSDPEGIVAISIAFSEVNGTLLKDIEISVLSEKVQVAVLLPNHLPMSCKRTARLPQLLLMSDVELTIIEIHICFRTISHAILAS